MNQWFRMYTEAVDDEKLGLLAFEDRWHYVALLCLKGKGLLDEQHPEGMLERKVAYKMGLSTAELGKVVNRLAEVGLVDAETMQPTGWDRRQYQTDSSAARTRAYRDRMKAGNPHDAGADRHRDVTVTPPDTDTEADTEKSKKTAPAGVDQQVWADFRSLRSKLRAPITPTALRGIEREAVAAGFTLNDALRTCCERGWRGFKAEWVSTQPGPQKSAQRPAKSFREQDREARMARWEQMTGDRHPERGVVDVVASTGAIQ